MQFGFADPGNNASLRIERHVRRAPYTFLDGNLHQLLWNSIPSCNITNDDVGVWRGGRAGMRSTNKVWLQLQWLECLLFPIIPARPNVSH